MRNPFNLAHWRMAGAILILLAAVGALVACGGGDGGGDGSTPSELTPTSISAQPASSAVVLGDNATFSVVALGDGLFYQWQSSADGVTWVNISSAISTTYTIQVFDQSLSGELYRVVVTGAAGAVTSSAVTLTVSAPVAPTISVQPTGQSVVSGTIPSFSVTASGTSLAYQWQSSLDGTIWTAITGATNSTLTLPSATFAVNAEYIRVVVSNAGGTINSNAVQLMVAPAPAAPVFATQPAAISVIAPQAAVFTASAVGTPAPAYQWQSSADGVTFTDIGGAASSSYTIGTTAIANNGSYYRVRASNSAGSVTSAPALLIVVGAPVAPFIASQPVSLAVTTPAPATFSVQASGTPTPTYQWQFSIDSGVTYVNVNGATSSTYTIPSTSLYDGAKSFRVVVSNSAGSVTSAAALLTVQVVGGLEFSPVGVASDQSGNIFVLIDCAFGISLNQPLFCGMQEVRPTGSVSNFVGSSTDGSGRAPVDGTGSAAVLTNGPQGLSMDSAGNMFFVDGSFIRKVTPSGSVTTLAGVLGGGYANGPGTSAKFASAEGLVVDPASDTVYVADTFNCAIRMISPAGIVSTFAGTAGSTCGLADGVGTAATFNAPIGMAIDSNGNLYVADAENDAIRKITPAGAVSTLAGGDNGNGGYADGPAATARFNRPVAVAVDTSGNVYVSDSNNAAIRKISNGTVSTLAGGSGSGYQDGTGSAAKFLGVRGMNIDQIGNILVTDVGPQNGIVINMVRKITPGGVVTTIAN